MAQASQVDKIMNEFMVTRTFANQMVKHKCATPDNYRSIRKKVLKTINPRKPIKALPPKRP